MTTADKKKAIAGTSTYLQNKYYQIYYQYYNQSVHSLIGALYYRHLVRFRYDIYGYMYVLAYITTI
jgi:hypothetical protein